jgi:hypothetical protein
LEASIHFNKKVAPLLIFNVILGLCVDPHFFSVTSSAAALSELVDATGAIGGARSKGGAQGWPTGLHLSENGEELWRKKSGIQWDYILKYHRTSLDVLKQFERL